MRAAPLALIDLAEKEWAAQAVDLARTLGWARYHTYRSTRSEAGFPDEVLVRERVVFLELKREAGKLSDAQKRWITLLLYAGAECYVARPHDLSDLGKVLAHRGDPWQARGDIPEIAGRLRERTRQEAA